MNFVRKSIQHILWATLLSLLLVTAASATTEFYLLPVEVERAINCEYVEIKGDQLICTDNRLIVTYGLARINTLQVVSEGKSFYVQSFTQEAITRINESNETKIKSREAEAHGKGKSAKYASGNGGFAQQVSFASLADFVQSVKFLYTKQIDNGIVSMILLGAGLVVWFIGSIGFLVASFRAGLLWGLCCMFLPFVSFIFLFVHWKVAAKPFFMSMLGVAIAFSGTLFVPAGSSSSQGNRHESTAMLKAANVGGRYTCSGKIYCSEMTSCAEAKFYLRNCPGTKMDGDANGIPCEKQWCGR